MATKENKEVSPLLPTDWLGIPSYRQKPIATNLKRHDYVEEVIEDDDEVFNIIDQKKKRNVNMVWIDIALLVLDFLQILALIQAMSLRWTFPEDWLRGTFPVFVFNIDIWELQKFTNHSVYYSVQNANIDSNKVDINFESYAIIWCILMTAICVIYGFVYLIIRKTFHPSPTSRRVMSWCQFGYLIFMHCITLPFGTVVFKLFQCTSTWNKVDVLNQYDCFSSEHWNLIGPGIFLMVCLFIAYPVLLIWKIRKECLTGTSDGHLTFVLMKETEYKIHLNWSWLFDGIFILSSFKYRGIFYRPMIQFMKLILLIIYTSTYNNIFTQSLVFTVFLLFYSILFMILRPYRLTSCNLFLIISFLCLTAFGFMGTLRSSYDSYTLPSSWLTPQYLIWFMVVVAVIWGISLITLLVYLVSRTLCHSTKGLFKRPVWPNIATSGSGQLTPETKKFMTAIIRAKMALDKTKRAMPIFAPVYDLARHVQIINAYTREAEVLKDALHPALWEVLDDLIETHAELSPKSLFAETVKKSIRKTAIEFMALVPLFSQRLAQRDYDFILLPPWKKRLLLKMYILGIFLNGRAEKVAKKRLLEPALERVWPPLPSDRDFEEEDGYYEDLYPDPVEHVFSDNILNVVMHDASDGESSGDEENVAAMLKDLPDIELIDLSRHPEPISDEVAPTPGPSMTGLTPSTSPRGSRKLGTSRPTSATTPGWTPGTATFAGLSPVPLGSVVSLREQITPNTATSRPSSASSSVTGSRVLSPVAPRPMSASSVVSSQSRLSSRPTSAGSQLIDEEEGTINPGYITEDDAMGTQTTISTRGGNSVDGFEDDDGISQGDSPTPVPSVPDRKKKKDKKKKQK